MKARMEKWTCTLTFDVPNRRSDEAPQHHARTAGIERSCVSQSSNPRGRTGCSKNLVQISEYISCCSASCIFANLDIIGVYRTSHRLQYIPSVLFPGLYAEIWGGQESSQYSPSPATENPPQVVSSHTAHWSRKFSNSLLDVVWFRVVEEDIWRAGVE